MNVNPNGKVSVYLHREMNIGDTVEVSVPAGVFHLDTESNKPVTLISGGVGITPMMSMFETIAKNTPERPVAFLHSHVHVNIKHSMKYYAVE